MSRLISIVCCCALVCSTIEATRILAVFPAPSIIHQVVFRPLTHELARRENEVVVITPDPAFPKAQAPENLTEIDIHDVSYEQWRKKLTTMSIGNQNDITKQLKMIYKSCIEIFEVQTAVPEVKDIIENNNSTFDLLLVEAWLRYTLGFSHAVKVPVIAVSSFAASYDNYDIMGAPIHPLLYHHTFSTCLYGLSLWENIQQYYIYYNIMNNYRKLEVQEHAAIRRIFGKEKPALSELQNNIGLMFLNIHPLWEGNRPVPLSVIHIGGIHQKLKQKLPQVKTTDMFRVVRVTGKLVKELQLLINNIYINKDLKKCLDSSKYGVIYLSFGSNVDTSILPADKIQAIVNVFSQLPYDVLWKWNQDELPGRTKNITISKWFPQSDLLKHPNVKLFITQGGLQSTDETITAGVPVIGIPMLADQYYNVEKYEHHRIGKKILLDDLNEEILKNAVKTVIEDKSYRENVVYLRVLMCDQPMSALERAVWWTEHVLRHGARHLRAPAANMGAFEYYELQLVLFVLTIAIALILLGSLLLFKIVSSSSKWCQNKITIRK